MIGLEIAEDRTRSAFLLRPTLLRHDGTLYGGTAIAASILAMEAATEREVQWITTQFVTPTANGETLNLVTEVLALGRRTAQLRVTAFVGSDVQFTSIGSTGIRKETGLTAQLEEMPVVAGPEGAVDIWQGHTRPVEAPDDPSFRRMVEYRDVSLTPAGPIHLWSRFTDGRVMTPAGVAFVADMVPLAVARGAGRMGAGASLDNSMRFGEVPEVEWVLLELRGNFASGGYGHGVVHVWAPDGALLAVGGQTASMIYVFDENDPR
jgi:acyl-CoA thioesterase